MWRLSFLLLFISTALIEAAFAHSPIDSCMASVYKCGDNTRAVFADDYSIVCENGNTPELNETGHTCGESVHTHPHSHDGLEHTHWHFTDETHGPGPVRGYLHGDPVHRHDFDVSSDHAHDNQHSHESEQCPPFAHDPTHDLSVHDVNGTHCRPPPPPPPPPPPQPETVYETGVVDGVPQHPDTGSPDDVNGVNNEGYNKEAEGFIGIVHTHGYTNEYGVARYNKHHHKNIVIVNGDYVYEDSSHDSLPVDDEGYDDLIEELEVPTPEPDTVEPTTPTTPTRPTPTRPTTTTTPTSIVPVPTDDMTEEQQEIVEEIIETPPEVVEEVVEDVRFEYGWWYSGINLVSFPVLPNHVSTIADLFAEYGLFQPYEQLTEDTFTGDAIYTIIDGEWVSYGGEADNPVGDIVIAPYMGFVLLLDYAAWIAMHGRRLVGDGEFELQLGLNLIGITEPPIVIAKPSDFLFIEGVCVVISRVITDLGRDKQWYTTTRVGDSGDEYPVELAKAYLVITTQEGTIEFEQDMDIPSAPPAPRVDNMTTSWGAMKR